MAAFGECTRVRVIWAKAGDMARVRVRVRVRVAVGIRICA